jgi:photosystem II stability/assembly factor-like uncharacterized protein
MVRTLWIVGLVAALTVLPAAADDFLGLVSVYQGAQNTDAFSSVAYLGQGIVVAGKRSWNLFPPNRAIYRSTDHGVSWQPVANPSGITGSHVYFFGQHDGRVFVGTGDTGNVCLMRSDDYGATWSVVLTTADLKALAGTSNDTNVAAIFSPVYMGGNRWLVNLRNDETAVYFLESLNDGDTWHAFQPTGIDTSARKMLLTSDGTLLYAGFIQNHGMYVSHDGGYSFVKTSSFFAFAGMVDLGAGSYLAGTFDSGSAPVALSIYKSSDYGDSWNPKATVSVPTTLGYFRTMIKVSEDLVIAYASCSENSWADRCAEAYTSTDAGETWTDLGPAFVGPYGNMNAIYDTVLVKPRTFIATAQPDSNILRSADLPPVARCHDVVVPTDPGTCSALTASIDDGSTSLDGDAFVLSQTPSGPYPEGTTAVTLTITEENGLTDSCVGNVIVDDQEPPWIAFVTTTPSSLWPPNHKMVPVSAGVAVTDNCDASPTCAITAIASDESSVGPGSKHAPDFAITGPLSANLRAERTGRSRGRVYTLVVACADGSHNAADAAATVTVSHDR